MKKTRAKRKLLPLPLLAETKKLYDLGVPLSKIIREKELDISRTTLHSLIKSYSLDNVSVLKSLFPEWLNETLHEVQENPDNWIYVGYFPFGAWEYDDKKVH